MAKKQKPKPMSAYDRLTALLQDNGLVCPECGGYLIEKHNKTYMCDSCGLSLDKNGDYRYKEEQ